MTAIKRIGILTSGGDAPGMNAAIRSVVIAANHYHCEVVGFYHGFNGLLHNEHIKQTKQLSLEDIHNIIQRGGTILKSARCPEMLTAKGLIKAATTLTNEKIDALIVIGGDGSFKGLLDLQAHWSGQIIGIPGTIDNDLDNTDFTIGFATAVNTAIDAIDKIRDTADAFENFLIDDKQATLQKLADEINTAQHHHHGSYIIVLAENIWPGGAVALADELKHKANVDCTACVLGHIQRGGSPVPKDRLLATKMGVAAVQALIDGRHNIMIAEQNNGICHVAIEDAVKHQKRVSQQLVDAQQNILALTAQNQY